MLDTFIITLATTTILLALYYLIKNYRQRRHLAHCHRLYEYLFKGINGTQISLENRNKLANDNYGLAYGEITFEGLARMLAVVQPKAGEIFYDLGSGAGKAVFCAALLYRWKKCYGIEILPDLYDLSLCQLTKFQEILIHESPACIDNYPIQFIQADFFTQDISDANIIFINATALIDSFWINVSKKTKFSKDWHPPHDCFQAIGSKPLSTIRCANAAHELGHLFSLYLSKNIDNTITSNIFSVKITFLKPNN